MISFDGWSGSGKTTQAIHLSKRLDIPFYYWQNFGPNIDNDMPVSIYRYRCLYSLLRQAKTEWTKTFTVDEFLYCLMFHLIGKPTSEIDEMLSLVSKFTQWALGGEPKLCIFLRVPYEIATKRFYARADKIAPEIDHPRWFENRDNQLFEIADYFESKLPYFCVVDGLQSPDKVSADIWEWYTERCKS